MAVNSISSEGLWDVRSSELGGDTLGASEWGWLLATANCSFNAETSFSAKVALCKKKKKKKTKILKTVYHLITPIQKIITGVRVETNKSYLRLPSQDTLFPFNFVFHSIDTG